MTFEGYEFDASYRPADYESRIREGMPFGVAFYLDQKYVFDENDVFLPEMSKKNRLVIYCPQHGRFFEEDKKALMSQGCGCHAGNVSRMQDVCPYERNCSQSCYLKNAVYEHKDLIRKSDIAFYQRTKQGIVLRAFRVAFDFSGEKYELRRDGEMSETEWLRIFYNADRTVAIYSRLKSNYNPYSGCTTIKERQWRKKKLFQRIADFNLLEQETKGMLLEGYTKYFELSQGYITNEVQQAILLLALFDTPALKEVIKAGYDGIAKDYIFSFTDGGLNFRKIFKKRCRTLKDFFEIEISKLDALTNEEKASLKIEDIPIIRRLVKAEIGITRDKLEICRNHHFNEFADRCDAERLRRTLKYLNRQKISKRAVFGDYFDYIEQAERLHLNMADEQVLYPKNLNRAHARLSSLVQYETTKELCAKFEEKASEYQSYCFRQRNISLRPVRTVAELKYYATLFSNCSAGYADRIAAGNSMIFVAVDRRQPKKPFYMLEYNPHTERIVQCRGYDNNGGHDSDPQIARFCEQWLSFIKERKQIRVKIAV